MSSDMNLKKIHIFFLFLHFQNAISNSSVVSQEGFSPFCIKESSLNMSTLHLVNSDHLKEFSLESCVSHCIVTQPRTVHVLISHKSASLFTSEKFNCICGMDGAVSLRVGSGVALGRCEVPCPVGKHKCGDASKDLLRVYCVKEECAHPGVGLCEYRAPYSSHGCIRPEDIDWSGSLNLHNLSRTGRLDCAWECKQHHSQAHIIITKSIGDEVTCNCMNHSAIQRRDVVATQFCSTLDIDLSYKVQCSEDLNSGDQVEECRDLVIGCVYSHLYQSNFTAVLEEAELVAPSVCQDVCEGGLPGAVSAGVVFYHHNKTVECRCSTLYPPAETLGPNHACSSTCPGGRPCGGTTPDKSLSVYCVSRRSGKEIKTEGTGEVMEGSKLQDPKRLTQLHESMVPIQRNLNAGIVFLTFLFVFAAFMAVMTVYVHRDKIFKFNE